MAPALLQQLIRSTTILACGPVKVQHTAVRILKNYIG
jgi:hypothetical protein